MANLFSLWPRRGSNPRSQEPESCILFNWTTRPWHCLHSGFAAFFCGEPFLGLCSLILSGDSPNAEKYGGNAYIITSLWRFYFFSLCFFSVFFCCAFSVGGNKTGLVPLHIVGVAWALVILESVGEGRCVTTEGEIITGVRCQYHRAWHVETVEISW